MHARYAAHARTFFQRDIVSIENKGSKILIPKLKVASSSLVARSILLSEVSISLFHELDNRYETSLHVAQILDARMSASRDDTRNRSSGSKSLSMPRLSEAESSGSALIGNTQRPQQPNSLGRLRTDV